MKTGFLMAGAVLALAPATADAAMLSMRVDGGAIEVADNAAGDDSALDGVLSVNGITPGGYEFVGSTSFLLDNQLQTSVSVVNTTGGPANVTLEVTGNFRNAASTDWLGTFSSTANDVTGSDWTIRSFVGSAAYDRGTLALTNTGSIEALSNVIWFDPGNYWITHVFEHAAGENVSATASADFSGGAAPMPEPIPVPAAGLLLLGGLGALAGFRRTRAG